MKSVVSSVVKITLSLTVTMIAFVFYYQSVLHFVRKIFDFFS